MKEKLPPVRFSGVSTGIELVLEVKGYDADDILHDLLTGGAVIVEDGYVY